jgi:hypothetical protein
MSLMSLGLVRGLVAQVLGTLAGMAVVMLIRIMAGMPAYSEEAVWVIGMLTGGIAFMVGVGSMDDWMKWWRGIETPMHHGPPHGVPAWTRYFGVDYNHKVIGIQYGVTGLILLMIGGGFAVIFRTELARSGLQFLDPNNYNTVISLHGWVALFSILLGIGGMANYVVPLMLGAEDQCSGLFVAAHQYLLGLGRGLDDLPALKYQRPIGLSICDYGHLLPGVLVHFRVAQLDRYDSANAAQRNEPLPHAHLLLGSFGHQLLAVDGNTIYCPSFPDALNRTVAGYGLL